MLKIAIGGMIGVGKSTLVKEFNCEGNYPVCYEYSVEGMFPILLKALYEGKEGSELALQFNFLANHHKKIDMFLKKNMNKTVIMDRHLIEHFYFAQRNLKKEEFFQFYMPHFSTTLANGYNSIPDLYIVLDDSWENIKDKILKRGREEEVNNFDKNEGYFKQLHLEYIKGFTDILSFYKVKYEVLNVEGLCKEDVYKKVKDLIEMREFIDA